jgi:hypothetical protein
MTPRTPPEHARAEVAELVPLHQHFAKQLCAVRLGAAEGGSTAKLYEKALRYERLVGRLDNRIRVALLTLAQHAER